MKLKKMMILFTLVLLVGWLSTLHQAASDVDIELAIENGVAWLAANQEFDGSWPEYWEDVATTGLAVLKLAHRAYELGYESPFDPAYVYSNNVADGLDYLFKKLLVIDITLQDHTGGASGNMDDPDTDGNGKGIYAHGHAYPFDVYDTGIVLSAISATGTPGRMVGTLGSAVDGMTYFDIAQDMADWLAWAQSDFDYSGNGMGEGGWSYGALDNDDQMGSYGPDNSNGGYAVLGLAYALDFGCTIPGWVMTELNAYIEDIQDPVDGDTNDGGSWYDHVGDTIGINILKTGNLIFEMALVGDTPSTPRVIDALDYLARHWSDVSGPNQPPGWDGNPAQYQAMFTAMKGLEIMGVETFDSIDWYADFSDRIVAQQSGDGSWQLSSGRGNPTIITAWALLTLERVIPNKPPVAVCQDIELEADENCEASITAEDVDGGSYDPDDDEIVLSVDDQGPFSPGEHIVTLTVTDSKGASDTCEATVTVVDATPPSIDSLSADPDVLWPPNHKMVPVTLTASATDNCDLEPTCVIYEVTSNEPENGLGDGDTAPDWEITGDLTLNLRAERSGTGNGRIYTIIVRCTDNAGNTSDMPVTVSVPHDKKK